MELNQNILNTDNTQISVSTCTNFAEGFEFLAPYRLKFKFHQSNCSANFGPNKDLCLL